MSESSFTPTEIACLMRILADKQPKSEEVDAIYLFHQTENNAPSSIKAARALYQELQKGRGGKPVPLAVAGWESSVCGQGYEAWQKWLVVEPVIVVPPVDLVNANSLTESQSLAKAAEAAGWRNVIVVAPPFHLLRSFITLISVLKSPLDVYAHPGQTLDWNTPSVHSQGVQQGTWMDFAEEEIRKIRKYHEKGDLLSFPEIVEYLNRRDRQGDKK